MFGVLDRYIGKTIFNTIMCTLFVLTALSSIIKFVDQLRRIEQGNYTAVSAGIFTLLSVPKDIEIFFPMAALLGALLGLGQLAMRNELVVMQAAGLTRMQIARSVMKTAIPLVLLTMAIGEWVSPKSDKMAHNFRTQQIYGASLLATQNGVWAKDGDDFIYIEHITGEKKISGINIYHFNNQHKLKKIRYAATASFEDSAWRLSKVNTSDLTQEKQVTGTQMLTDQWQTNLTPEKLSMVGMDPTSFSIKGLVNYVKYLKQSGQESNRYQLNLWNKVFSPLSVAVMMLMALSFIFGPLRSVPMGIRVITGISSGFLFYALNQIIGQLSIVYKIPPVVAALLPNTIFLMISVYMLLKRKW
ncbi:LPS export ABC transporter permease LptG [Candidatus Gillettellia adelgis]